jgi:Mg2+-importing ATPase
MFSAAGASIFLSYLPMLLSQVLLNNLLYDSSQLAIPTDNVDEEQLRKPSHWEIGFIRRFMLIFGPLSSVFDFLTFGFMLWVLHAGPAQFRTGWFIESLATQTLIIFAIRTRRVPFFRSQPSVALVASAATVVIVGAVLPFTPLGPVLGFQTLPAVFFGALVPFVLGYLVLVEWAKGRFYAIPHPPKVGPTRESAQRRHLRSRAAFFHARHPAS